MRSLNPFRDYRDLISSEKVGVLIGCLLIENNIEGLPSVGAAYYLIMFIAFIYLLSKNAIEIDTNIMTCFLVTCVMSIIFNNIPSFFNPWERFITFTIIVALASPWLISDAFIAFRIRTLVTIMRLLQFVVIISCVYAFLGKGHTHVYFQGITNHSMMLGPFSAICALYSVSHLVTCWDDKRVRITYGIVLLCSLFCLLQAGSRTAFIGTLVALMLFFAVYYHNSLGKYFKIIISISVVLACSFPLWGQYMDKLEKKNAGNGLELNTNSREAHWMQRLAEFESSPVFGIGFSSVDIKNTSIGSTFDLRNGKVETGSSWLSVLSMTGIVGFIFFLCVILGGLKKAWSMKDEYPLVSGFLIALLSFWICHMIAEGYILAGGNTLAFFTWLTLGVIYGVVNNERYAAEILYELAE